VLDRPFHTPFNTVSEIGLPFCARN